MMQHTEGGRMDFAPVGFLIDDNNKNYDPVSIVKCESLDQF